MNELPFVSVVIPMFNEERSIHACLSSILSQDYPAHRMEVLVIDGASTDRSPEIIRSLQQEHENLRIVNNPRRLTPTSLNRGIQEARGELFVRMDAHSSLEPDYVRTCVEVARRTGAENVGGLMRAFGVTLQGRAIALATSSPFGVGGARFHYTTEEQYVDTVYLGCYRLDTLRSLGGYDEGMIIDEDDELNFRLTRAGGRIFLSPRIRSSYQCRSSFRSLWKQYFRYGKWKVRLIQKHTGVPSLRHLVPGAWVLSLLVGLIGWAFHPAGGLLLLASLGSYLLASLLFSVQVARSGGWSHLPLLPLTFLILHASYGAGFLAGIVRFVLLHRPR